MNSSFSFYLLYNLDCVPGKPSAWIPTVSYKQRSKETNAKVYSFWPKDQEKRSPPGLGAASFTLSIPSYTGVPILPTVVASIEPESQHILYLEWLDILGGKNGSSAYDLSPALYLPVLGGQRKSKRKKLSTPASHIPTSNGKLREEPFTFCWWYQQGLIRSSQLRRTKLIKIALQGH